MAGNNIKYEFYVEKGKLKMTPKTLCIKCANHMRLENSDSPRYNVWYNQLCKASPLEEAIDPVTGESGYKDINDLGGIVFQDDTPYQYCREINKGNCLKFYPKETT